MRLLHPIPIVFDQAIIVAVIGLVVNGASVFRLGINHEHDDHHHHEHDHHHDHHAEDQNLRAAYFDVLADALYFCPCHRSIVIRKIFRLDVDGPGHGQSRRRRFLSPVGVSDCCATPEILDRQAPDNIISHIKNHIEDEPGTKVEDLHVWAIGPGLLACEVCVTCDHDVTAEHFKTRLPKHLGIVHATIEIHKT